jgi:hypothetical protein
MNFLAVHAVVNLQMALEVDPAEFFATIRQ